MRPGRGAPPPAPYSEVRRKSSPHVARARPRPLLAGSLYRSSRATATERWSWQLKLHSKESVEPINVANLRVNQRSQINEDTVEPSLADQDINPISYNIRAWPKFSLPALDSYPVRSSWLGQAAYLA